MKSTPARLDAYPATVSINEYNSTKKKKEEDEEDDDDEKEQEEEEMVVIWGSK